MEAQDRPGVEERAILFMEAQDRVKKKPLFKMRNSSSETLFQTHDQSIQSLERGCPSVEEQTILFMEAQDRPSVKEQTILFMEAQDRPTVEEQTILFMEAQDRMKKMPLFKMAKLHLKDSVSSPLPANSKHGMPMTSRFLERGSVPLIDAGLIVEEWAILFMEAQDHVKKKPLFKIAPSVKEETILFLEAKDRMKKAFIQSGITSSQTLGFRPITS
ncbi:hypothetical protein Tco_0846144 [Tanacetum coccineum]